MIELAAHWWKLDLAQAARQLACIPPEYRQKDYLDASLAAFQQRQQAARAFWQTAQARLPANEDDVWRLTTKLDIAVGMDVSGWFNGGGQYVGSCSWALAREILRGRPPCNQKGTGALVLPAYDLPGRFTGFLLAANLPEQQVRHYGAVYIEDCHAPLTSGLFMLPAALQGNHEHLGNSLFILNDPLLALRLQLRWLQTSCRPVPLVSVYSDVRATWPRQWPALPCRDRIFVTSLAEQQTGILQAKSAHGRNAVTQLTHETLSEKPPLDWLRQLKREATVWQAALESQLLTLPAAEAQILLHAADLQDALEPFKQRCSAAGKAILAELIKPELRTPQVTISSRKLVERNGGWYVASSGELVCNAIIRIDRIIHTQAGRSYYCGHVEFDNASHPFTLKSTAVARDGLFACVDEVVRTRTSKLLNYGPRWAKLAASIATQFSPPEVLTGVDRVGWDRERNHFRFPTFVLLANGRVESDSAAVLLGQRLPGDTLPATGTLLTRDITAAAATSPEVHLFWTIAAAITQNLLSPVLGHAAAGISVSGQAAHRMGQELAVAIGSLPVAWPTPGARNLAALQERLDAHDWPAWLNGPTPHPDGQRSWMAGGPRNCFLPTDWFAARVAATYGWTILEERRQSAIAAELKAAGPRIVSGYLQDLCSRRLLLPPEHPTVIANILYDMADWLLRVGGRTFDADAAVSTIVHADPAPVWPRFVDLVAALAAGGELPVAVTDATASIPQGALNRRLSQRQSPPLDVFRITQALQSLGVLQGEQTADGDISWVVPADWWTTQTKLRDPNLTQRLRLVR